jgi:hypothetical protein
MGEFIFSSYGYDEPSKTAHFRYQNNGITCTESVVFTTVKHGYNHEALQRALFLAFVLIGTSYYKTFPSTSVRFEAGSLDSWQADFFTSVYQDGMSQFAFENNLTRADLATFSASTEIAASPAAYKTSDTTPLVLQSGGKDSLLLASLLRENKKDFTAFYISSGETHPSVLEQLGSELVTVQRIIDKEALRRASKQGGLNGHVPVTYIVQSIALLQAILLGKDTVLTAIGHEGEEPYRYIQDLPVRHQWAKIWQSEQQFAEYVQRYVANEIHIGSPLRKYTELKIAELFTMHSWHDYAHAFSSCNVFNYTQGHNNTTLGWCGNCAKCANSFLLFAPFVALPELTSVFNGENLFKKPSLQQVFKGLLGIDGAEKPFECIGEEAELRTAYHMAHLSDSQYQLPFSVPESHFNYQQLYPSQSQFEPYIHSV